MWAQWDWGTGPKIAGRPTYLFCAWLAWSPVPGRDPDVGPDVADGDRLPGSVDADVRWGADVLADRQRADRDDRPCRRDRGPASADRRRRRPLRGHGRDVRAGRSGIQGRRRRRRCGSRRPIWSRPTPTCSTTTRSWAELVDACEAFMAEVNGREHRVDPTGAGRDARRGTAAPAPAARRRRYTAAFGETRKVSWSATISFGGVTYSVPHTLVDETVWVRVDGDEIVATHCRRAAGAVEVARHPRSTPGHPRDRRRPLPAPTRRARSAAQPKADQRGGGRVPGAR